jgi:hypothetical protein
MCTSLGVETVITMYRLVFFTSVLFCLGACNSGHDHLHKKWRVARLDNPAMDAEIKRALIDMDTTGNNDAVVGQYIDKDSLKQVRKLLLQQDLDEQKMIQESLRFDFRESNIAYITSMGNVDSALWRIEQKDQLIIDGPGLTGIGDVDVYTILSSNADSVVLRNINMQDTVRIVLMPALD